jgi:hypothetical protein
VPGGHGAADHCGRVQVPSAPGGAASRRCETAAARAKATAESGWPDYFAALIIPAQSGTDQHLRSRITGYSRIRVRHTPQIQYAIRELFASRSLSGFRSESPGGPRSQSARHVLIRPFCRSNRRHDGPRLGRPLSVGLPSLPQGSPARRRRRRSHHLACRPDDRSASCPTSRFVPSVRMTGRSVLSLSVRQGTPS